MLARVLNLHRDKKSYLVGENRGEMFLETQDAAHKGLVLLLNIPFEHVCVGKTFTLFLLINNFERWVPYIERTTAVHSR